MAVLHLEFIFRLLSGHFPLKKQIVKFEQNTALQFKNTSSKKLDKKSFQYWINHSKPYLKPDFSIENAVNELGTNRTYISKFIDETYGMNFSRYLNELRLKELGRLLLLPSNKNKSAIDMVAKAGFGSYRSYLRAKSIEKMEQENKKTKKTRRKT